MFSPPGGSSDPFERDSPLIEIDDIGTDIEFGGRRRQRSPSTPRRARPSRWWVLAAATTTVAAIFFFAGRSSDPSAQTPATSVPRPTTTLPPTTTAAAGAVSIFPTVPTTQASAGPLLRNDHGWGLFVIEEGSGGSPNIRRIDLNSGTIDRLVGDFSSGVLGITGTGPQAAIIGSRDLDGASSAVPGPDGTMWSMNDNDRSLAPRTLRQLRVHVGRPAEVIASYEIAQLGSALSYLAGSTADGRPVFAVADGSLFIVDPANRGATRLSPASGALLSSVDHGNYAAVDCDPSAHCSLVLHGAAGATANVTYSEDTTASISPDGTHGLIFGSAADPEFAHMVDIRTGTDVVTRIAYDPRLVSMRYFAWAPDGSSAFVLSGRQLAIVDASGLSMVTITLPDTFSNDQSLVGVA